MNKRYDQFTAVTPVLTQIILVADPATGELKKTTIADLLGLVPGGSGWLLTGNSGTTAGTNYIGTSDNKDLVIKTDNTERIVINKDYGDLKITSTNPDQMWFQLYAPAIGKAYTIARNSSNGMLEIKGYQSGYSGYDFITSAGTVFQIATNGDLTIVGQIIIPQITLTNGLIIFSSGGTANGYMQRNSSTGEIDIVLQNYSLATFNVIARNTTAVTMVIRSATSQTGNMLEFQNSALGIKSFFNSEGFLGINTNSIPASAIFCAESTTKGILIPRMTTTQKNAISSPAEGLEVYDLTLHKKSYYNGSAWVDY